MEFSYSWFSYPFLLFWKSNASYLSTSRLKHERGLHHHHRWKEHLKNLRRGRHHHPPRRLRTSVTGILGSPSQVANAKLAGKEQLHRAQTMRFEILSSALLDFFFASSSSFVASHVIFRTGPKWSIHAIFLFHSTFFSRDCVGWRWKTIRAKAKENCRSWEHCYRGDVSLHFSTAAVNLISSQGLIFILDKQADILVKAGYPEIVSLKSPEHWNILFSDNKTSLSPS